MMVVMLEHFQLRLTLVGDLRDGKLVSWDNGGFGYAIPMCNAIPKC